jgi:hypothetical protein
MLLLQESILFDPELLSSRFLHRIILFSKDYTEILQSVQFGTPLKFSNLKHNTSLREILQSWKRKRDFFWSKICSLRDSWQSVFSAAEALEVSWIQLIVVASTPNCYSNYFGIIIGIMYHPADSCRAKQYMYNWRKLCAKTSNIENHGSLPKTWIPSKKIV